MQYQPYRELTSSDLRLIHLTNKSNLRNIIISCLEPRLPTKDKYWNKMKAIFLADVDDPIFLTSLQNILKHVADKENDTIENLFVIHIKTQNILYKASKDLERTFQVISLDPINISDFIKIEPLNIFLKQYPIN